MPVYAYKGLQESGREVKALLEAESPRMLRAQLRKQGIRIVEYREEAEVNRKGGALKVSSSTHIDFKKYFERVSVAELALVTRQMATLLRSGITLINTLSAIVDQVENEKLKRIYSEVKTAVNEGSSLADALAKYPSTFPELYVSMVRAGEASGALDQVLVRLADFTEAQAKLRSKISSAMLYPVIMLAVGGIIMVILFIVVIPRITKIFEQVKAELPIQTKLLIGTADLLRNAWFVLLPLVGFAIWGFFKWKKSKSGRPRWDRFTLRVPVLGPVVRLVAIARFARTLATLLRSGVPVLAALDITKDVLNNVRLAEVVSEAREAIREGDTIAGPLKKSQEFPPIVVHMVATGEQSGQLEEMLEHVAGNYDFQVEQKVEKLTTLIEPIMIVGMGGAVAFIVFSILLPILQLSQHVR